jgi:Mn-dependent DtxR family transcriptional regulator
MSSPRFLKTVEDLRLATAFARRLRPRILKTVETVEDLLEQPTRRAIVQELLRGDARNGAPAARLGVGAAAVSKHLRLLQYSKLVCRRIDGAFGLTAAGRELARGLEP